MIKAFALLIAPLVALAIAACWYAAIKFVFLAPKHIRADRDTILAIELVVLGVALAPRIWEELLTMARQLRPSSSNHHSGFTTRDTMNIFICLGVSMVIFVAVVKVLDLKLAEPIPVAEQAMQK